MIRMPGLRKGGWRPPDAFTVRRDPALHHGALCFGLILLTACQQAPKHSPYKPLVARLHLETRSGEGGVPVRLPLSGVTIRVGTKPVLVESDLRGAEVARVELGACLLLQVAPAAAHDLCRLTAARPGRRLVLMLNGQPLGVHRIEQALADGVILVFVEKPAGELPALAGRLRRTSADLATVAAKK